MSFDEAIKTCLHKYAILNGRASRSEYWWFILFGTLVRFAATLLDLAMDYFGRSPIGGFFTFDMLAMLALFAPNVAVTVRRLHDTGNSALLLLGIYGAAIIVALASLGNLLPPFGDGLGIIALIGGLPGLVFLVCSLGLAIIMATKGTSGPNTYGEDPLAGRTQAA